MGDPAAAVAAYEDLFDVCQNLWSYSKRCVTSRWNGGDALGFNSCQVQLDKLDPL